MTEFEKEQKKIARAKDYKDMQVNKIEASKELEVALPYGIVDPDYAKVFTKARCVAWMYGYAVLMQGSFTRDLDLLIVPWTERVSTEPQHIIDMICDKCDLAENGHPPTKKPHGRLAYTLMFKTFGDPRFIDIGFMPKLETVAA